MHSVVVVAWDLMSCFSVQRLFGRLRHEYFNMFWKGSAAAFLLVVQCNSFPPPQRWIDVCPTAIRPQQNALNCEVRDFSRSLGSAPIMKTHRSEGYWHIESHSFHQAHAHTQTDTLVSALWTDEPALPLSCTDKCLARLYIVPDFFSLSLFSKQSSSTLQLTNERADLEYICLDLRGSISVGTSTRWTLSVRSWRCALQRPRRTLLRPAQQGGKCDEIKKKRKEKKVRSKDSEWIRSCDHALNLNWDYHPTWQALHDIPVLQEIPVTSCKI